MLRIGPFLDGQGAIWIWLAGCRLSIRCFISREKKVVKMRSAANNNLASGSRLRHRMLAKPSGSIRFLVSLLMVDGQATYIVPPKDLTAFFEIEHEYMASSHFKGTSCIRWYVDLSNSKPPPPKK
jgi:hypothetical protein